MKKFLIGAFVILSTTSSSWSMFPVLRAAGKQFGEAAVRVSFRHSSPIVRTVPTRPAVFQCVRFFGDSDLDRDYGNPKSDTGFKQLLAADGSDHTVAISLLNSLVPDFEKDPIKKLKEESVALPAVRTSGEKQTFMDFHVTTESGEHVIVEMQVKRHVMFDERALFYAAGTFSRQLSEEALENKGWFEHLRPTYAVQILDYDTNRVRGITHSTKKDALVERVRDNPLDPGSFMKHYMMTDRFSGQIISHLQMLQLELPRVPDTEERPLFPPRSDFEVFEWWMSIFKHATDYTKSVVAEWEEHMPPAIQKAFGRLDRSVWSPELQKEYVIDITDLDLYSTEIDSNRAEADKEARVKMAEQMMEEEISDEVIARVSNLSPAEVTAIKENLETRE